MMSNSKPEVRPQRTRLDIEPQLGKSAQENR